MSKPVAGFEPKPMKISVLTAALQELTPREKRDADPDLAIEEWLQFSRDIGSPYIELSTALHPSVSDVPAEAMLDPVANTLDLREPFNNRRAARVRAAMTETGVGLSDLAYFDNMLIADDEARRVKHEFMLRVFDAAVMLETDAVCGFVGRNYDPGDGSQSSDVRAGLHPAVEGSQGARADLSRGTVARCRDGRPWTAGTTTSRTHRGPGIALHRICEKHGVGDQFRIHYDPSHSVLMGQDTRSMFQYLKNEGYDFLIDAFHVKGQVVDSRGVSAWGYGGQTMQRGDWTGDNPSDNPADQLNAWKKTGRPVRA